MREIKFRYFDNYDNKMVYMNSISWGRFWDAVDPGYDTGSVLMQYTGLKDKNSKEIYESDIVKRREWYDKTDKITHVIWRNGGFTYDETTYDCDGLLFTKEWEVIGNIYENPELIKNNP